MSDDVFNEQDILREVAKFTDEGIEAVAREAASRAKNSAAFVDKSGKLRSSIKAQKGTKKRSENETVWLVRATAPHSHLIEYGHAMVTPGGRLVGHVAAHPFLQPAVDSVMPEAENIAAEYLKKISLKV